MTTREKGIKQTAPAYGLLRFLWHRKVWWLLPLAVLFLLLGIMYVLGHMSSADSEMYPTTSRTRVSNFCNC